MTHRGMFSLFSLLGVCTSDLGLTGVCMYVIVVINPGHFASSLPAGRVACGNFSEVNVQEPQ